MVVRTQGRIVVMTRSAPGFFKRGVMTGCLEMSCILPVVRDKFTIFVIVGNNSLLHSFKTLVGIWSNIQVFSGYFITTFSSSSTDTARFKFCKSLKTVLSFVILVNPFCGLKFVSNFIIFY